MNDNILDVGDIPLRECDDANIPVNIFVMPLDPERGRDGTYYERGYRWLPLTRLSVSQWRDSIPHHSCKGTKMRSCVLMLSAVLFLGCDTAGGDGSNDNSSHPGTDNGGNPGTDTIQRTDTTGSNDPGTGVNQMALYESGTRIKAKVATTADGAKAFQTWYDTQLDINCMFNPTADGKMRCVPGFASQVFYSDSGCADLVFAVTPGLDCYGWTYDRWGQVCQSDSHCYSKCSIYELGNVVSGPTLYQKGSDGQCNEFNVGYLIKGGWVFHAAAKQVDPSIFAEVTISIQD